MPCGVGGLWLGLSVVSPAGTTMLQAGSGAEQCNRVAALLRGAFVHGSTPIAVLNTRCTTMLSILCMSCSNALGSVK